MGNYIAEDILGDGLCYYHLLELGCGGRKSVTDRLENKILSK